MKRHPLALAAAALLTLSTASTACDPKTEIIVDLRGESPVRIFEDLASIQGWTLVNIELLDGRNLTANFKTCTVREALDKLAASIGLAITLRGTEITFVAKKS